MTRKQKGVSGSMSVAKSTCHINISVKGHINKATGKVVWVNVGCGD
jgi:hypothetical protein